MTGRMKTTHSQIWLGCRQHYLKFWKIWRAMSQGVSGQLTKAADVTLMEYP